MRRAGPLTGAGGGSGERGATSAAARETRFRPIPAPPITAVSQYR